MHHDGSYFVSGIPDYVKYIIKNHEAVSDNPPIIIYVKKKENKDRILSQTLIAKCLGSQTGSLWFLQDCLL